MMLSITVFLTFTFLLGFLIYTDSGIYNKYKELMGNDYKIILSHNGMDSDSGNKINILTSRLEEMGDTHFYYIKKTLARDTYGNQCHVQILPNYVWAVFEYGNVGVERVEMNGEKALHYNRAKHLFLTECMRILRNLLTENLRSAWFLKKKETIKRYISST